jgi:hypothetical protein
MCIEARGRPPTPTHEAAHHCGKGNEGCTNPKHIYWATSAQNQSDRIIHGTTNRGSRQGQAKLTEFDVLQIRQLMTSRTQTQLAQQFQVSPSTISNIKTGKNWSWLKAA